MNKSKIAFKFQRILYISERSLHVLHFFKPTLYLFQLKCHEGTQQNHHQNLDKRKNRLPFETAANIESRSILEEDRREIIDHTCTLDSDHVVYGWNKRLGRRLAKVSAGSYEYVDVCREGRRRLVGGGGCEGGGT